MRLKFRVTVAGLPLFLKRMIMVNTLLRFLRTVSPWVFALLLLLVLLGGGLMGAYLLSKVERSRIVQRTDSFPEASFIVSGQDPSVALDTGLSFLYLAADDRRIAQSIVRSLLKAALGEKMPMESLRESFAGAPFLFLIRERGEGKLAWLFSAGLDVHEDLAENLHDSFHSQFPAASIRTRTVPSGKTVEDVIFDGEALVSTEESWHGYRIRRSTHAESGMSFLTAEKNGEILLSNDRSVLIEILLAGGIPQKSIISANPAIIGRFAEVFPDSDLLRHVQGMIVHKEEALSLSSFVCIP